MLLVRNRVWVESGRGRGKPLGTCRPRASGSWLQRILQCGMDLGNYSTWKHDDSRIIRNSQCQKEQQVKTPKWAAVILLLHPNPHSQRTEAMCAPPTTLLPSIRLGAEQWEHCARHHCNPLSLCDSERDQCTLLFTSMSKRVKKPTQLPLRAVQKSVSSLRADQVP